MVRFAAACCAFATSGGPLTAFHVAPRHGNLVSMALDGAPDPFDSALQSGSSGQAVRLLTEGSLEPTAPRVQRLLDAACGESSSAEDAPYKEQMEQQDRLLSCYKALAQLGALRGFGSASRFDALPAPMPRVVLPEDQMRLTGLPTTAFAPPRGNGNGALIAGAATTALIVAASEALKVDFRVLGGAGVALLAADRALLRGTVFETVARAVRPKYRETVIRHEAGHFLIAYLLGLPLQACLLDAWAALKDGRFAGAAGTVFFDPALGDGMQRGTLTRETLDRYSVVVMAGIAAEAMVNGQAEGGQADESALIQLLGSLDGGKAWDLPRIQNQARWAASQALLLLREHREPYEVLVASLEKGCSVGECIVQLEASLTETFGRNGELPAETRLRVARARLEEEAQRVAAPKPLSASRDSLERELEQVDQKLAEAQRRLEALDSGD